MYNHFKQQQKKTYTLHQNINSGFLWVIGFTVNTYFLLQAFLHLQILQ